MSPYTVLVRTLMFALTTAACLYFAAHIGPWAAIPAWAAAIGALCAAVAFLMHRQPPGKRSIINRLAWILMPWGYKLGRGRLIPIVVESSIRWTLLGIAIITLAPRGLSSLALAPTSTPPPAPYQLSVLFAALLLLSWTVYAELLFRMITIVAMRSNPMRPGTLPPLLAMAGLTIGSAALVAFGHSAHTTWFALALAGGPILIIGGGYALFLLVVLTIGKNARWN